MADGDAVQVRVNKYHVLTNARTAILSLLVSIVSRQQIVTHFSAVIDRPHSLHVTFILSSDLGWGQGGRGDREERIEESEQ